MLGHIELWERSADRKRQAKAIRLRKLYEFLATHLYYQYEPTKHVSNRQSRDFLIRLNKWLDCFDKDQDRWNAYRSIEYLLFAGVDEFEELYRCAKDQCILPWLVDLADIDIFDQNVDQLVRNELDRCWLCPATDSLRINSFLHVTGLKGKELRPDWYSLKHLGDPKKISKYKTDNSLEYLVLLEDFSGSGGQLKRTLKFAVENFSGPILVIPLIICAPGDNEIRDYISKVTRSDVSYSPVLIVNDSCLIRKEANSDEPALFSSLRSTLLSGYNKMGVPLNGEEFGWEYVGSLVALFSNCPNNTPPMYHHGTSDWSPIFPRLSRC